VRVEVVDGPELMEESIQAGAVLSPSFAINGRIASAGEEDRFEFAAKKSEKLIISLRAGTLGSSLDALLRIEDEAKKELLRNEDSIGDGDLRVEWTAPADGKYRLIVSDLKRQGSKDAIYRLSAQIAQPSISATVANHELKLKAGQSTVVKVNVARLNGHAAPLVALATDLPAGVTSSSATVGEKGGEVSITLSATADSKASSAPIRLVLLGTDTEHPFAQTATYDLSKEALQSLVASSESIWLTLQPLPPATQPATKPATQPAAGK
jgi:hypothetical protein